jgi:threonine dehydratase
MMTNNYIEKILRAKVYDVAEQTPLDFAPNLSERIHNRVYLKREDLQPVFSFKIRGAYNKMASLSESQLAAGVIAASAGNHAQGVALAAKKLGVKAIIVMPKTTPDIKVKSVKSRGAKIILHGESYDEAYTHAMEMVSERGMTFIHPYDDPDVIAGQGTVAMEILRQYTAPIHAIFVPVGGGGLIAGVAAYIKFVCPDIRVIGVEPDDADCLNQALRADKRVKLSQVGLFADGVAVRQIGEETFRLAKQYVDEVITVSTDEICAAIKDIFDDTRSVAEPSGALSVAGLKRYAELHGIKNQTLVAIDSGANINFDRLRYVAERTLVGENLEILLAVTIPEVPGSFLRFCKALGRRNITEFNYRYYDPKRAQVYVGISSTGLETDRNKCIDQLVNEGFSVLDMTQNELAKDHIRHMVGGHKPSSINEMVYSLEFPERPGALLKFLMFLGNQWNITLFHYRNHGAAFGKVLLGVEIRDDTHRLAFERCLNLVEFGFEPQSANLAYQLFAGGDNTQ